MTIDQAIAQVDSLRPNVIDHAKKIGWLTRVDQYIYSELMESREGAAIKEIPVYTEEDGSKTLLAPPPYDELYTYYLEAQIYYAEREITKFGSSMALYNEAMREYRKKYMREHRAKTQPPVHYW